MNTDYSELIEALRDAPIYSAGIGTSTLENEAADAIEALTAENAELREANRWIPCNERLPEEGQEVEVMNAQDIISAKYEPNHNQFFPWLRLDTQRALRRAAEYVTHWRLPDAIEALTAENIMLRKMQPITLDADSAQSFILAIECSRLEQENAELREVQSRQTTLLKACCDFLNKQRESGILLKQTVFYDEADCDGYCLLDDIKAELNLPDPLQTRIVL